MDNDPYKTPAADLQVDPSPVRSAWWKIYFVVYLLLVISSIPDLLLDARSGPVDWLYVLLMLAALTGLFGFVFMKRILGPRLWLPVTIAVVLADIAYPYLSDIDLAEGMSRDVYLVASAIGWALSIPNYVALYLYSRPGNPVWRRTPGSDGH